MQKRCKAREIGWYVAHSTMDEREAKQDISGIPYSSLTVGVPREIFPNECRVALTPQNVALLRKKGFSKVLVEENAGTEAQFLDEHYVTAGATLVSKEQLLKETDILLKVRPPLRGQEDEQVKEGSTIISFLYPTQNKSIVEALASRNVNAFAVSCPSRLICFSCCVTYSLCQMDMIPRISRAQVFDALRCEMCTS